VIRKEPHSTAVASPARARSRGFSSRLLRALTLSATLLGAAACGPDGRSVGDECPDLPLYRFVYDGTTDTWKPVTIDDAGAPLSADALARIQAAAQQCVTPAGHATGGTDTTTPDAGAK
jgi:hypothetical protein